jgi:hypothetical protein
MLEQGNIPSANNGVGAANRGYSGAPPLTGSAASRKNVYDDSAAARVENRQRLEAAAVDETIGESAIASSALETFNEAVANLVGKQGQAAGVLDEADRALRCQEGTDAATAVRLLDDTVTSNAQSANG